MDGTIVPPNHPRVESLKVRERLIEYYRLGVVATAGLIAHGRGEAFDYLIGERTTRSALKATRAAAAAMLLAERPVISVNGNVAALVAEEVVKLAESTGAKIEVNLFYRSRRRESAIMRVLKEAGAREVLGVGEAASMRIPEVCSDRRRVDPRGIFTADLVLVPLEDGDRTEALRKMGKTVVAIDLNPLSRTAQWASITIVDNVVRAFPLLVNEAHKLKNEKTETLQEIVSEFDNREILTDAIKTIEQRLLELAERGVYIPEAMECYKHQGRGGT
ncbi:phosphopantothenate/pantothenate synthetase [Candidatus Bathyarchaeota archaeon]|nr:phosphopantothenate/pantothenate synthetase [Candidatus Bathyarchaeota archaeon]